MTQGKVWPKGSDVAIFAVGGLFGLMFRWSLSESVIFLFFLLAIRYSLSVKKIALITGIFFFSVPVLLLFGFEKRAEILALYSYYLLVILTARAMIEIGNNSR